MASEALVLMQTQSWSGGSIPKHVRLAKSENLTEAGASVRELIELVSVIQSTHPSKHLSRWNSWHPAKRKILPPAPERLSIITCVLQAVFPKCVADICMPHPLNKVWQFQHLLGVSRQLQAWLDASELHWFLCSNLLHALWNQKQACPDKPKCQHIEIQAVSISPHPPLTFSSTSPKVFWGCLSCSGIQHHPFPSPQQSAIKEWVKAATESQKIPMNTKRKSGIHLFSIMAQRCGLLCL